MCVCVCVYVNLCMYEGEERMSRCDQPENDVRNVAIQGTKGGFQESPRAKREDTLKGGAGGGEAGRLNGLGRTGTPPKPGS